MTQPKHVKEFYDNITYPDYTEEDKKTRYEQQRPRFYD